MFILFLQDLIKQRRRSLNPAFKHKAVKDIVTKNCLQAELVRRDANCSSDPCQRTICSGSSQLSVSPDYNYEGKGHFSCSERHPNELVATYLTPPCSPPPETFRTRCWCSLPASWMRCFCCAICVRRNDCKPPPRKDTCVVHTLGVNSYSSKNNKVSKVMP